MRAWHGLPLIAAIGLSMGGCSATAPVKVTLPNGQILRGSTTGELSGGRFEIAGSRTSCVGEYDALSLARVITLTGRCSDGRTAHVVARRDPGLQSGRGRIVFSNGEQGSFIFGPDAARF